MDTVRKAIAYYMLTKYTNSDNDRIRMCALGKAVEYDPLLFLGVLKQCIPELDSETTTVTNDATRKEGIKIAECLLQKLDIEDYTLELFHTLLKLSQGILNDLTVLKYMYRFQLDQHGDSIIGFRRSPESTSSKNENEDGNEDENVIPDGGKLTAERVRQLIEQRYTHKRNATALKPSRTEPTKSNYAIQVRDNLIRLLNRCDSFAELWRLPETIEYISKEYTNPEVARLYLSAIAVLLRVLTAAERNIYFKGAYQINLELLSRAQKEIRLKVEAKYREQQPRERQREVIGALTWSQLCRIVKNAEFPSSIETKSDMAVARNIALVRLYTIDHDPRRLELTWLRWKNYDEKRQNYYEPGTGNVVLNEYKTSAVYGPHIFTVSTETQRMLRVLTEYLDQNCPEDGGLLDNEDRLEQPDRGAYVLQRAFRTVCGYPISCQVLRKMRIEHAHTYGEIKYFKERAELARRMGHSVDDQQLLYTVRPSEEQEQGQGQEHQDGDRNGDRNGDRSNGDQRNDQDHEGRSDRDQPKYTPVRKPVVHRESNQEKRQTALHPNTEQILAIKKAIAQKKDKVSWKDMIAEEPETFAGVPKRTIRNWGYRMLQQSTQSA